MNKQWNSILTLVSVSESLATLNHENSVSVSLTGSNIDQIFSSEDIGNHFHAELKQTSAGNYVCETSEKGIAKFLNESMESDLEIEIISQDQNIDLSEMAIAGEIYLIKINKLPNE